MSILIKGMEMPTERESFTVTIKYNGLVFDTETGMQVAEAQEVPPHGALMDRDDFFATCPELVNGYKQITDDLVVIKAEEGET